MRIAFYGSSLLSSYWNGAATYYRGILRALAARGHAITFYEPDAFDRQSHRDIEPPDWCRVVVYSPDEAGVRGVLAEAGAADVVVKASGVGVNDDALLIGMLLDQQVPMEWAFKGPWSLRDRLGGELDAGAIAAMGQDAVVEVFCAKPALHRYPAVMARRTHELCQFLVDHYDGDAGKVWKGVRSGDELYRRLRELPGYGEEKAKIFLAILGKRLGIAPAGWEQVAAPFSDAERRSVADADTPEHLQEVRAWKKMMKAQKKSKSDAP